MEPTSHPFHKNMAHYKEIPRFDLEIELISGFNLLFTFFTLHYCLFKTLSDIVDHRINNVFCREISPISHTQGIVRRLVMPVQSTSSLDGNLMAVNVLWMIFVSIFPKM